MEIKEFTKKHRDIFEKLGVEIIYLFGSQATGTANSSSDADFGVVLTDIGKYHEQPMEIYGAIYEILLEILPKEYLQQRMKMRAHEFDIVFLQEASLRMRYKAAEDGIILYQVSNRAIFNFKEQAMTSYFDFKYFEQIQKKAFLNI